MTKIKIFFTQDAEKLESEINEFVAGVETSGPGLGFIFKDDGKIYLIYRDKEANVDPARRALEGERAVLQNRLDQTIGSLTAAEFTLKLIERERAEEPDEKLSEQEVKGRTVAFERAQQEVKSFTRQREILAEMVAEYDEKLKA